MLTKHPINPLCRKLENSKKRLVEIGISLRESKLAKKACGLSYE